MGAHLAAAELQGVGKRDRHCAEKSRFLTLGVWCGGLSFGVRDVGFEI